MESKHLSELKLVELKSELKRRRLSQQGKKAVLINRLKCSLDSSFLPVGCKQTVNCLQTEKVAEPTHKHHLPSQRPKTQTKRGNLCFKLINRVSELEEKLHFLKVTLTKLKLRRKKCEVNVKSVADPHQAVKSAALVELPSNLPPSRKRNKNSEQTSSPFHEPPGNPRKRIFIAGDGNGEDCVSITNSILQNHGGENSLVTSFLKPNALFEEVLNVIPKACSDFNFNDHIFILAGTSDVLKDKKVNKDQICKLLTSLYRTNVTIFSTTYCHGRVVLNDLMYKFNCDLVRISKCFSHVKYIETNKILKDANVTNFYPTVGYRNKKIILKSVLFSTILYLSVNNNLIVVPLSGNISVKTSTGGKLTQSSTSVPLLGSVTDICDAIVLSTPDKSNQSAHISQNFLQ